MNSSTFMLIVAAFCLGLSIAMTSCSNKKTEANSAAADSTVTADSATSRTPITSLDFNLSPLYVTSTTFVSAINSATLAAGGGTKQKLLLQFVITGNGNSNFLNLEGWFLSKPDSKSSTENFDPSSDIQLTKITSTTTTSDIIAIEGGTYFGNLFINHNTLDKLYKKAIPSTPANQYMVFFPEIKDHHIQYKVVFSPTIINPTKRSITTRGADGTANPTPPRQYETN